MPAILFGSISTVADTSELQREAFNRAFEAHGLTWRWDRAQYRVMLEKSSGRQRIADFAASLGQTVDADAVHATKSELFQKSLAETPPTPRPGVVDTVRAAKAAGVPVALVTTTSPANVSSLLQALRPELQPEDFSVVVDSSDVDRPKPDGAAYTLALQRLDEKRDACIAIEDNVDGVRAAVAAGVTCVAFPNDNTADHDFAAAPHRADRLAFDELLGYLPRA